MFSKKLRKVLTRPDKCPKCGNEVYDVIRGYPSFAARERHYQETGHHAVLGGCEMSMPGEEYDYCCEHCGLKMVEVSEEEYNKGNLLNSLKNLIKR